MKKTKELSLAADFISKNNSALVDAWEITAREKIVPARQSKKTHLRNHLSELLNDLAHALRSFSETNNARSVTELNFTQRLSRLHADNRSSKGTYQVHDVLEEYILLRHVITDTLSQEGITNLDTVEIINGLFEKSSLAAVKFFQDSVDRNHRKMLASLTHDIRTPLTVASMAIEFVDSQVSMEGDYKQFTTMASRSIEQAISFTTQMLDSFSLKAGGGMILEFSKIKLKPFIAKTVEEAGHRFGKRLIFSTDSDHNEFEGVYAGELLVRVIENLISNAFKYGSVKGEVVVSLRSEGESVLLAVKNVGKVIEPKKMKEIFTLFQTEGSSLSFKKTSEKSWGVGLTHLDLAARAHNGKATLTSDKQNGTIFTLQLQKGERKIGSRFIKFEQN